MDSIADLPGTIGSASTEAVRHCAISSWTFGIAWASYTVLFEVGLGRVRGLPWSRILADYDLSAGRVWILVPITLLIAPVVARALRKRARGARASR